MAVPPAAGPVSAGAERPPAAAPLRLALLAALVVLLLVAGAALAWLLADRRGHADAVQSQRDAVMAQTRQFVLRLNTYGPDALDGSGHLADYRDRVDEVITPKFAASFESSGLPIAEQTVKQAGYARTATVVGVGVESLGTDTAVALVAAGLEGSYADPRRPDSGKRVAAGEDVLRWEVDLVRTGGRWLVDDYRPVTGAGAAR